MIAGWDRDLTIVHPSLDDDVAVLSDRVPVVLSALVVFVILINVVIRISMVLIGDPWGAAPTGVSFLAAGIGLVIAMAIVWHWLDAEERTAAFPFRFPSTAEFGWTIVFLLLNVAVASVLVGVEPFDYNLTNSITTVGVLLGPILIAPLVEEVLFRGLLLGSLIGRGWSPLAAGLGTILLFAVLHIWLGVAGMIGMAAWAVFPTILRLRFDNLTGAILFHLFNNVYAYVISVILFS